MKVGPFFKWFGSKWLSSRNYPPPKHECIVEPFAGSAGYSCNYSSKKVVLWEDDPNLFKLWKWLIEQATPDSIMSIPLNLPVGHDIRNVELTEGQALLLKHWQRTNNVGDCWTISPWGNKPGQWTEGCRRRLANQICAIKHWKIRKPIEYIDTIASWFIDPPYQYNYRYRTSLPSFDYNNLVSFVDTINRDSQIIVCEAVGAHNGERPNYLPFVDNHRSVTSRRKPSQSHHSKELVYLRG